MFLNDLMKSFGNPSQDFQKCRIDSHLSTAIPGGMLKGYAMNCLGILRQRKIPYGDFSNTAPCPAIPRVFLILGHIRCPRMSMHALGYPWRAHGAPMAPFGAPNFRMMSRHITYPQIHISHSERSVCTCFGSIPAIEIMGLLKRKLLYTSRRLFRWNERLRKTLLR